MSAFETIKAANGSAERSRLASLNPRSRTRNV